MVDFNTWMSIGMEKCAPTGIGTGNRRERVWGELVEGWKREEETIRQMSAAEVRRNLECP